MLYLSIKEFASIIGSQQAAINYTGMKLSGVAIDSRKVNPGEVFFALQGENFDGHHFLMQALNRGAVAAIVEQLQPEINLPQLQVSNTLNALAKSVKWWRQQCPATVISVCGSNGKTTVKNILIALLESLYLPGNILGTQGNLNNHIGVPLTLFRLKPQHQVAVIEMGANHPGEILSLAELAQPDIAIITNAGLDHLQGFGSVLGSAQTNAEVLTGMTGGIAILNADDEHFPLWCKQADHLRVISFACHSPADLSANNIELSRSDSRFIVNYQQQCCQFELSLPGQHNISNALAAIAALLMTGKSLSSIATAMSNIIPLPGRLSSLKGWNGCQLIDDSYNANPSSLLAALTYFKQCVGNKWLILGDMTELGIDAASLHSEAGRQAKRMGVIKLLSYGEVSRHSQLGFAGKGKHFTDINILIDHLRNTVQPTDTLLIKGSHSMKMERVVTALMA